MLKICKIRLLVWIKDCLRIYFFYILNDMYTIAIIRNLYTHYKFKCRCTHITHLVQAVYLLVSRDWFGNFVERHRTMTFPESLEYMLNRHMKLMLTSSPCRIRSIRPITSAWFLLTAMAKAFKITL